MATGGGLRRQQWIVLVVVVLCIWGLVLFGLQRTLFAISSPTTPTTRSGSGSGDADTKIAELRRQNSELEQELAELRELRQKGCPTPRNAPHEASPSAKPGPASSCPTTPSPSSSTASTVATKGVLTKDGSIDIGLPHRIYPGPRHTRVLERTPVVTPDLVARAKPQLVVVWGSHFFGSIAGETPCPVKCVFAEDPSRVNEADAVWTHIPTFSGLPARAHPNQKFVAMSMEGDGYYPRLKDKDFMAQFDYTMTYRLDSDIPTPYPSWSEYDFMLPPINKTAEALAVVVISNCGPNNKRNEWVQELMQYIKVDSYGRCFHNKEFPEASNNNWFSKKIDVLRPYKFYLAFDNTDSFDYVSEKFFHGLVAGSVPVYMGAPNIEDFSPSPHSVIRTDSFKSPRELADYLLMLDKHDDLYQEYLQWKVDGPSQKFRDLVDLSDVHSRCRLCIRLAQDQLGLNNESQPK